MSLLDFFKRAPKRPDGGDTGKPNILIMLPVYLMQGGEEPFADMATNYNEPKLDIISVYVTLYKVFCYNKLLLLKFGKDIYYSTILDKQRERVAPFSLEFSETFASLMRMFHELDELPKDVSHPDLEHLIGFTLIRKENEFSDIKDNEDEGVEWSPDDAAEGHAQHIAPMTIHIASGPSGMVTCRYDARSRGTLQF